MQTVFVVNPKAGQGKHSNALIEQIQLAAQTSGADVQIYTTTAVGDAERFVRAWCEEKGPARFIACGGDGTLSEVLNGAVSCRGAEIGVMPAGTGNDFCRNFENREAFSDALAQIGGETVWCDAIHYRTIVSGAEKSGYCINMFNIGFDCNVADMVAEMKKKPFVSGSLAYVLSIFVNLIRKKGADLVVEIDGEECHRGPLLLTSIANGSYCGGGIMSNPLASVTDGNMSVNVVKNISRMRFMGLLPHYMKGTFLKLPAIDEVILTKTCQSVKITPQSGEVRICCDGEIFSAGETEFTVMPGAFQFVLPGGHKEVDN